MFSFPMAPKQRKLFPTNITDCQTCPDSGDCYSFPFATDPEFFFPLPPPPPPPPPHPSASTPSLSPYLVVSVSVFAAVSLLAAFYVVLVKPCFRRRARARSDGHQDFLDHSQGPEPDHHIWYINSIGLTPSVINSIAVFKYKRGDAPIEGSVCPVCLSEFGEDETLRLLPQCRHAFHVACIDTWLRSHTNCPLCRAGILSNPSHAPPGDENTDSGNNVDGNSRGETEVAVGMRNSQEITDSSGVDLVREKGRRSVSMHSWIGLGDFSNDQLQGNLVNEHKCNNFGANRTRDDRNLRIGSSSSTESLRMSPVSMKRSFSCSGRLFSSSRYSSKSSSSILPL